MKPHNAQHWHAVAPTGAHVHGGWIDVRILTIVESLIAFPVHPEDPAPEVIEIERVLWILHTP